MIVEAPCIRLAVLRLQMWCVVLHDVGQAPDGKQPKTTEWIVFDCLLLQMVCGVPCIHLAASALLWLHPLCSGMMGSWQAASVIRYYSGEIAVNVPRWCVAPCIRLAVLRLQMYAA